METVRSQQAEMDMAKTFADYLEKYQDPEIVWRFQNWFGVEKVRVTEQNRGKPFVAIECSKNENLRRSRSSESSLTDKKSSEDDDSADSNDDSKNTIHYSIGNRFWHFLFLFGSQLGDETYYAIFFSFWFWNIDGAVGRRVILVWNLVMYIGQAMKDILRLPRPAMPPVIQLESKWALEYGMPSTHAMVGLSVPLSILVFTYGRYQYPFYLWAVLAVLWCSLVCSSRIYLGMHSIADIIGGLSFSSILLVFVIPFAEWSDQFILTSPVSPLVTVTLSILAIIYYPGCDKWTPARGDTTVILGSYLGIQIGFWLNYQTGVLKGPPILPPYPILWPSYEQYGETLLRMMVGGVIIVAIRAIFKPLTYFIVCCLLGENMKKLQRQKHDISNRNKLIAELSYKFVTYIIIGINVLFIAPYVFRTIGCERATFHTEV